ncbi:hypothetical protein BDQ12DRAFT_248110 [Crucibulum laeve]|uniref:Uncharacterized protein n=1 Tax=Crucibulum laeve TaxID=68775 RepID=A0A5C3LT21_9AGAR|nr:hypothetical protein BDQ12DRAFT_248110 [Crucibulum laeve]
MFCNQSASSGAASNLHLLHYPAATRNTGAASPAIPGMVAGGMGMAHNISPYSDPAYHNRAGSPVSIQEQRVLQVTNPQPPSPANESFQFGGGAASSSMSYPPAPQPEPQRDGKGRPISIAGQKMPIVHTDGGRFQEQFSSPSSPLSSPPAQAGPSTAPAPPAYAA